jgi:hypothetical protein
MPLKSNTLPNLETLRSLFELAPVESGLKWRVNRGRKRWTGKMAGTLANSGIDRKVWKICILGRMYNAHRIAWALANGEVPDPDAKVTHLNGDSLDNRPENLKLIPATVRQ